MLLIQAGSLDLRAILKDDLRLAFALRLPEVLTLSMISRLLSFSKWLLIQSFACPSSSSFSLRLLALEVHDGYNVFKDHEVGT